MDAVFAGLQGKAIRIESSQPISVLLLRGTHAGTEPSLLYETVPIAVTW